MESRFNPTMNYFQLCHLWVLLPNLPLQLWNGMEIYGGDRELFRYFHIFGQATLSAPNRKLGKILVEMDIHGGLLEHIEIEWRGRRIFQKMDYLGIPFRCSLCRNTGHLRRECFGWVEEEVSKIRHFTKIMVTQLSKMTQLGLGLSTLRWSHHTRRTGGFNFW
jgi:hypothetical protein